jgi:hypothetical protein
MSSQSRLVAGVLLILLPTVEFGGASLLSLLIGDPEYTQNELRQDLWRAGHTHAGVLMMLSLVTLRYVGYPSWASDRCCWTRTAARSSCSRNWMNGSNFRTMTPSSGYLSEGFRKEGLNWRDEV